MKWMLIGGAALGALGVAFGAFGAHALDGVLDERARGWYDTAVTYHAGHAFALLACGLLWPHLVPTRVPASVASARTAGTPVDAYADASVGDSGGTRVTRSRALLNLAAGAFLAGIALFSGSLYVMAFTGWTKLGMVTPLGGVALIAGWILFAAAAARLPRTLS